MIRSVAVYCGSSPDVPRSHLDDARAVGEIIGAQGLHLVYGGGRRGSMGEVADGCLATGGKVTGVIPEFLQNKEIGHHGLTSLEIVQDMHIRKRRMFDLAEAFLILPGGFGTLEELFEVLTWKQLGEHDRPILIANLGGYWSPMHDLITAMERDNYLHSMREGMLEWLTSRQAIAARLASLSAGK